MSDCHKPSQNTEDYGCIISGNRAEQAEIISADEFKARLAADDAEADDNVAESNATAKAEEAPVKKKPKSKKPKPTGFEEYHADAPLTPAEHAEEQRLYDRYFATALHYFITIADVCWLSRSIPFSESVHPDPS
jgi:hypothetical protein